MEYFLTWSIVLLRLEWNPSSEQLMKYSADICCLAGHLSAVWFLQYHKTLTRYQLIIKKSVVFASPADSRSDLKTLKQTKIPKLQFFSTLVTNSHWVPDTVNLPCKYDSVSVLAGGCDLSNLLEQCYNQQEDWLFLAPQVVLFGCLMCGSKLQQIQAKV